MYAYIIDLLRAYDCHLPFWFLKGSMEALAEEYEGAEGTTRVSRKAVACSGFLWNLL